VLKRRTRRDGDTLRHSFAIKRGIAITGLNVNSRVERFMGDHNGNLHGLRLRRQTQKMKHFNL
jgi:hypothetical protein